MKQATTCAMQEGVRQCIDRTAPSCNLQEGVSRRWTNNAIGQTGDAGTALVSAEMMALDHSAVTTTDRRADTIQMLNHAALQSRLQAFSQDKHAVRQL